MLATLIHIYTLKHKANLCIGVPDSLSISTTTESGLLGR